MSIFTGLMVYVVIWWIVFFMALPVGVRTHEEAGEDLPAGSAESAPARPRLWLKAAATTAIAAGLWGLFVLAWRMDFFGLGEWVRADSRALHNSTVVAAASADAVSNRLDNVLSPLK